MSFQTDWMMIRSDLCVEHWLFSDSLCKQKSHWIITINGKMNVWKCKLIFPTDTLQQKIEITYLNHFLAGENTSVLIILATTVCVCVCVYTMKVNHFICSHVMTIQYASDKTDLLFWEESHWKRNRKSEHSLSIITSHVWSQRWSQKTQTVYFSLS